MLDMTDCDLTAGLSGFSIGVNTAYCFALPEGAESFLSYKGKCVGYYQELEDRKEIVVGFDIRESDFPLRAEFPVFLANAMIYLSDTSWLATNVYYAGEKIALQPWAELDRSQFESRPVKAGLYTLGNEEHQEDYVVRFQTIKESDGRLTTNMEGISDSGAKFLQRQKVKRTIRNLFMILAFILLVIEWIVYVRQMRYHGKFYWFVRGVVLLCVVLALFGIQIYRGSGKTAKCFRNCLLKICCCLFRDCHQTTIMFFGRQKLFYKRIFSKSHNPINISRWHLGNRLLSRTDRVSNFAV